MSEFARQLRQNQTPTEALLWSKLRANQLLGLKFKRQFQLGTFVVDFYCHASKLVVEIDGDVHYLDGAQNYDRAREERLKQRGLTVLRFTTNDVLENIDGVLEKIRETVFST